MANLAAVDYSALAVSLMCAILGAKLQSGGYSTMHATPTKRNLLVIVAQIPLTFLSNFGSLILFVWAFWVMDWRILLAILFAAVIVWGLTITKFMYGVNYSEARFDFLAKYGRTLSFGADLVGSICVAFLVWAFLFDAGL